MYEFNDIARKELVKIALDRKENWKFRWAAIESLPPDYSHEYFIGLKKIYEDRNEQVKLRRYAIQSISSTKKELERKDLTSALDA